MLLILLSRLNNQTQGQCKRGEEEGQGHTVGYINLSWIQFGGSAVLKWDYSDENAHRQLLVVGLILALLGTSAGNRHLIIPRDSLEVADW